MVRVVLSVIGDDRAGLVDSLSGIVVEQGGSWEQSHLTQLAGKFAGIVLVVLPDGNAAELEAAMEPLRADGLLDVSVEVVTGAVAPGAAARPQQRMSIELVGQDRPGIVHEVSEVLAANAINIVDLQTGVSSAPMAGGLLFEAKVLVDVPDSTDTIALRSGLEALADELMVDFELTPTDD